MPGFGVASVFGALLGAFAAAMAMGRFRLATFSDAGDTLRNLIGAALMGVGGVMALGCTVGQAITGVSTLALGSFVTFAAIVAGGFYGLRCSSAGSWRTTSTRPARNLARNMIAPVPDRSRDWRGNPATISPTEIHPYRDAKARPWISSPQGADRRTARCSWRLALYWRSRPWS